MQVFVLYADNSVCTATQDVHPDQWVQDFAPPEMHQGRKIVAHIDPDTPERVLFTNQIRVAIARIVASPDDLPFEQKAELIGDLLYKCCFYWFTGVMAEFEQKSRTHNGYVKIDMDSPDIEWGWMEKNHLHMAN